MKEEREEEQFEEKPEVYTVKKDLTGWKFNRRSFLAVAGAAAAVAAAGTVTGCNEPTPQEQIVVVEVVATPSYTPPPAGPSPIPPAPQVPTSPPPPGPTEAMRPSDTPPVSTRAPTFTPTPVPDKPRAEFVKDVTIPDGTEMRPGQRFTKTWRYRNSGNVPWGEGVQLVFVEGTIQGYASHPMAGPEAVSVPNVAPGNTVDISVNLVAPDKPGRYRSYWRLRLPNGDWLENNHYVEIVVKLPATATPPPTPTTACECVGHTGCQCDGHCAQHAEPKPTREKHYWHPN